MSSGERAVRVLCVCVGCGAKSFIRFQPASRTSRRQDEVKFSATVFGNTVEVEGEAGDLSNSPE